MREKNRYIFLLFLIAVIFCSCQKELDWDNTNSSIIPVLKPKVGTVWMYHYYTYRSYDGGIATLGTLKYKAENDTIIAGEKWLNIIDIGPDTTVYLLQEKIGGLYQYTSNSTYLLCKYPAAINDTYNSFNFGSPEVFIVKGVKDTLQTGIGDVPVNFYEGSKAGIIKEWIWYHENAWIVRHYVFRKYPLGTVIYKYSGIFLQNIVY